MYICNLYAIQGDAQTMNRMSIYIIIGLLLLGLMAYFIFRPKSKSVLDDYFISTQSQTNDRVKNLNLDKASEDASYILDTNKLSFPKFEKKTEKVEYKADSQREWIINLIQVNGENFKKEDFTKMFDYEWRSKFESTIYGFSPEENRWTYADAGGTPNLYSKLQIAIDIQGVYNEENANYDPQKLERYITELEKRVKNYPSKLKIEQTETIDKAIIKAKRLVQLHQEFNSDAIIVLQSDKQYNGLEVWDALQCVGLAWGDGDLFHWSNNHDYGHDQHFSVWTATEPGYFLPEDIKAGNMNPKNLVFGFSIPRSADPKNIYCIMLNAAKYCQRKLGGQILDKNGQLLNEAEEKQNLIDLLDQMKSKGIIVGSDNALRTF